MLASNNNKIYLVFLAYIFGLLFTGFNFTLNLFIPINPHQLLFIIVVSSLVILLSLPLQWRFYIAKHWFIIAGLITITAYYYYQWRVPTPQANDISNRLTQIEQPFNTPVEIKGKILTPLRVNRSQRSRFILEVKQFQGEEAIGKVYVTAPLLETKGMFPSMNVTLKGNLYQPAVATHPGGFDFASFLARQGIWAGFTANQINLNEFGNVYQQSVFWLRQRVTQTHVRFLNVPHGTLVSAMVIGSRGVDLPFEIQDLFRDVGLAHILSASGFHVSLLLGAILWLTREFSPSTRFICGISSLFFYLTLTGFYPSVLRASVMGLGVLIALVGENEMASVGNRKVNVLAMLLLTAVVLLLINPLWIWDLGFQFSFLATLGLIISVTPLVTRWDFLPPTVATLIAVPLSATIWIFPLQGYVFNRLPIYSVITNILATPFVFILSFGGMLTGLIGLFFPFLGSAIALILLPFSWTLIELVKIINNLPLASLAIGQIPLIVVIFSYGVYVCIWLNRWCQKQWLWISLFLFSLIVIPLGYQKLNSIQVTVIQGNQQPLVIIENKMETYLINLPDKNTYNYNLKNLFSYQGINSLDLLVYQKQDNDLMDYNHLKNNINIKYENKTNNISNKSLDITKISSDFIQWQFKGKNWLLVNSNNPIKLPSNLTVDTLIWSGNNLDIAEIEQLKPTTVISYRFIPPVQKNQLKTKNVAIYSLINDGSLQWQPEKDFQPYLREN